MRQCAIKFLSASHAVSILIYEKCGTLCVCNLKTSEFDQQHLHPKVGSLIAKLFAFNFPVLQLGSQPHPTETFAWENPLKMITKRIRSKIYKCFVGKYLN